MTAREAKVFFFRSTIFLLGAFSRLLVFICSPTWIQFRLLCSAKLCRIWCVIRKFGLFPKLRMMDDHYNRLRKLWWNKVQDNNVGFELHLSACQMNEIEVTSKKLNKNCVLVKIESMKIGINMCLKMTRKVSFPYKLWIEFSRQKCIGIILAIFGAKIQMFVW